MALLGQLYLSQGSPRVTWFAGAFNSNSLSWEGLEEISCGTPLMEALGRVSEVPSHPWELQQSWELLTQRLKIAGWSVETLQRPIMSPVARQHLPPRGQDWDSFLAVTIATVFVRAAEPLQDHGC